MWAVSFCLQYPEDIELRISIFIDAIQSQIAKITPDILLESGFAVKCLARVPNLFAQWLNE